MTEQQRIERARQAEQALEFLDPAFAVVTEEYQARLMQISSATPWEANKISALANAIRIVGEVRGQIGSLVADGIDAQAGIDRARKIEQLSPAKRRFLQIAPH